MQHSGYLWIILPQLRKIYGDNTEALKTAARTQCGPVLQHTSNFLNTIITAYRPRPRGRPTVSTASRRSPR